MCTKSPTSTPGLSPLNRSALTDISVPSPTYFCWVLMIAQGTGQVCLAPFPIEKQRLQATPRAACSSHGPDPALRQAFPTLHSSLFQLHPQPPAQLSSQIPFMFNRLLLCRVVLDNGKKKDLLHCNLSLNLGRAHSGSFMMHLKPQGDTQTEP